MRFSVSSIQITVFIIILVLLKCLLPNLLASAFEYLLDIFTSNNVTKALLRYVVGTGFSVIVAVGSEHPTVLDALVESFPLPPEEEPFCPSGFIAALNSSHIPSANGCGARYIKIAGDFLPYKELESCCNAHDVCYDTCHITWSHRRESCDILFKECLANICDGKQRARTLTCFLSRLLPLEHFKNLCQKNSEELRNRQCNTTVEVMYRFVESFGKTAYDSAQKQACVCLPTSLFHSIAFYFTIFVIVVCFTATILHMCSEYFVYKKISGKTAQ